MTHQIYNILYYNNHMLLETLHNLIILEQILKVIQEMKSIQLEYPSAKRLR